MPLDAPGASNVGSTHREQEIENASRGAEDIAADFEDERYMALRLGGGRSCPIRAR